MRQVDPTRKLCLRGHVARPDRGAQVDLEFQIIKGVDGRRPDLNHALGVSADIQVGTVANAGAAHAGRRVQAVHQR